MSDSDNARGVPGSVVFKCPECGREFRNGEAVVEPCCVGNAMEMRPRPGSLTPEERAADLVPSKALSIGQIVKRRAIAAHIRAAVAHEREASIDAAKLAKNANYPTTDPWNVGIDFAIASIRARANAQPG